MELPDRLLCLLKRSGGAPLKVCVCVRQVPTKVAVAVKQVPSKLAYGIKALADGDDDTSKIVGELFPKPATEDAA